MRHLLFLLSVLALCLSCSGDENNKSNNANNENNENNTQDMGTADLGEFDNSDKTYASEYALRVNEMVFDEGTAAAKLNGIVEINLDQTLEFPIIILLNYSMIDPDGESLLLRGGAGVKTETEEEYDWEITTGTTDRGVGTLEASTGLHAAEIELFEFIATFQFEDEVNKVTIPIQRLNIEGNLRLSEDGSTAELPNGRLAGYLTKEDGDTTLIALAPGSEGIPLTMVFLTGTLNYNTSTNEVVPAGDPSADAWYITGRITAQPTTIN